MTDREKMICAIEKAKRQSEEYAQDRIFVPFKEADMIVSMLREQEPVKPMDGQLCGECGCRIYQDANYCYNCGKAVKWDE